MEAILNYKTEICRIFTHSSCNRIGQFQSQARVRSYKMDFGLCDGQTEDNFPQDSQSLCSKQCKKHTNEVAQM